MERSVLEATARLVAGRYRLVHRIAAGGMGEIFLAVQDGPRGFQKLVALKRLLSEVAGDKDFVQPFLDEARLASRLTHRNIAQVFDFGEDEEGYFVAMEFVQGVNLRMLLNRLEERGQRLAPALALDIAAQVAEALSFAWETRGPDGVALSVVHRDISPQNVMVSISGDVKVIDFGVAKSKQQLHATVGRAMKGKWAYMSPEQSRGEDLDTRSDLFSLGIVLCQMLTGAHPFARADVLEMVSAVRSDPPALPSTHDPSLAPLDATLERMLAKVPEDRFRDCHEVADALQSLRLQVPQAPVRLGLLVSECFGQELDALVSNERIKTPGPTLSRPPGDTRLGESLEPGLAATLGAAGDLPSTLTPLTVERAPSGIRSLPRWRTALLAASALVAASAAAIGAFLIARHPPTPSAHSSETLVRESAVPEHARGAPRVEPSGSNPEEQRPPTAGSERAAAQEESPESGAPAPRAVTPESNVGNQTRKVSRHKGELARPTTADGAKPSLSARQPAFRMLATLPSGTVTFALGSQDGTVKLTKRSGMVVYLDYSTNEKRFQAQVRCEPWAIVAVDGVSIGKTPVALPSLPEATVKLDLRRPGVSPFEIMLGIER